jgi:aminoglycoside phosphotransferase (APT) family kinase protein
MVGSQFVGYLLDAGLLSTSQIISGVRVVTASGRIGGVRVISNEGPSYFLKQARTTENRRWLAREASIYQWLHRQIHQAPRIPAFHSFDLTNGILVLGLEPDANCLFALDVGDRHPPRIEAAHAATALARLHKLEWDASIPVAPAIESNALCHARWLANLPTVYLEIANDSSAAALQAIRLIQADAEFCAMLRESRDEWNGSWVIHGDIRSANIMIRYPVLGEWRISLVDWEAAGLGDPCWDIGCYFSMYLNRWVRSMPFASKVDLNEAASRAICSLSAMKPAISTFWETYTGMMALGSVESSAWLTRSIRICALRLLQMTLEAARNAAELAPQDYAEMQLARNILEHPMKAARQLLGVSS